jgi:uncharacterized membrane protein
MYVDFVIVLSLIIVSLTCLFLGFISYYAYKHIKADIAKAEASNITG